jgi:RNA-binding protein PNO1
MPKVTRASANDILLEAAPVGLDREASGMEHDAEPAAVKPKFAPLGAYDLNGKKIEFRRVSVPQNRMTPLKNAWLSLYKPVTETLKLDMRMNLKTRKVRAAHLQLPPIM